jgi:raffinose/stachyose/melibiose transport system permease protein
LKNNTTSKYLPYFFMMPAILIVLFVYIVPFSASTSISLTDWNGIGKDMKFIGLRNYIDIVHEHGIREVFMNNLKYLIILVVVQNILGLIIALLLNREFKARNFFRATMFLPTIIATVAVAFIWNLMLDPFSGFIPSVIKILRVPFLKDSLWLGEPGVALYIISIISMWQWTGWNTVMYLSGLQSISKELFESADIDGASKLSRFWHITIPMLAPALTINVVYSTIGALKIFDLPFVMTKGGPGHSTETLAMTVYNNSFSANKMGYGTALSMVLFAMVLMVSIFQMFYLRKREENIS